MSRLVLIRAALVAGLTALAVLAAWLVPLALTPPDRFAVAMRLIDQGRADEAVHLLDEPAWKGVAQYRAGRYQRALYAWITGGTADDYYNVGNAYARLHNWAGAKAAYTRTLRLDPAHADGKFNLALVERAEAAERKLEEDTRITRNMGRWKDGDREEEADGDEPGSKVERGGADRDAKRDADVRADEAGTSDRQGTLGDEPMADERMSGAAAAGDEETPADAPKDGAGRALVLRESTQAAEVLLRAIRDDPARVLRARLKAAHRLRQEAEGACEGC